MTFEAFRAEMREVGRALSGNLVVLDSVASTNHTARRILRQLPPEVVPAPRTFLVAHEQTGGRGRLGRSWESPAGRGLYCSLVEPLGAPEEAARLPLTVAVALSRAGVAAGATDCRIKWPNDLMVGRRKLGGILIEVTTRGSGSVSRSGAVRSEPESVAIVGFGINLSAVDERLEALGATTLEAAGAGPTSAADLLLLVASELESLLFDRAPGDVVVAAYRELLAHRPGDEITWRQGNESLRGRFAGVDDSGRMMLDTERGRRSLAVGDIIES